MKKYLLIILLITIQPWANAAETDLNKIGFMINEIERMYNHGIKIHFKYDMNDLEQLKVCARSSDRYREKGKKLMKDAQQIGGEFGIDMSLSADAAFQCVYCRPRTLQSCLEITPMLSSLKVLMLKHKMQKKYGEGKPEPVVKPW